MSILSPGERRARAAADALLERDYERLRGEIVRTVAGKLAAAGVQLPAADLDAAYNQAWHGLHTKLVAGETVDNHTALLVTIAHRRALDEHRAQHPGRRAGEERLEELATEDEVDARLDDVTQLRQFVAGLRERLDRRELEAAALCYVYEYSRPEAARLIGVQPKRMEKIMDAVSRKLAPMLGEIRSGAWCEQHRSLMTAYALGLLEEGGERHALARDHLDGCSACRRSVLRARGIAAVTPPAPLLAAVLGAIGVGAGVGGAAGGSGAHGVAGHVGRDPRTKLLAGAGVAGLAAAVVAVAIAAGLFRGGDETTPPAPPPAATPQQAQDVRAARAERARARAQARARARARARAARRAAARRRAAAARAAPANAAAAAGGAGADPASGASAPASSTPGGATPTAPPSAPAPTTPPSVAPTTPDATPAPRPPATPRPAPTTPSRDGGEEFDLR